MLVRHSAAQVPALGARIRIVSSPDGILNTIALVPDTTTHSLYHSV